MFNPLENPNDKKLKCKVVCLATALCLVVACEVDMTVKVNGENPPTFDLSGSGNLNFFYVAEVAPENLKRVPAARNSGWDTMLWEIRPHDLAYADTKIWKLPPITYGKLPQGFVQKIPADGEPAPLVEGKMYVAGGPASNANGGATLFTIRDGKAVTVEERW